MHEFYFLLVDFVFLFSFEDIHIYEQFKKNYCEFLVEKKANPLLTISIRTVKENKNSNYLIKNDSKVTISFPKNNEDSQYTLMEKINWIIKIVIVSELSKYNFTLLHASGFCKNDDFYLFAGDSGTGKSTVSNIAKKNGYLKPCDDSVLIREHNNKFIVYSTPFVEKEKTYYKKSKWELSSIFFLSQSSKDFKKKLSKSNSIKKIMTNTYLHEDIEKNNMSMNSFLLSQKIAKKIPCYDLYFTKSNKFLKVVLDN